METLEDILKASAATLDLTADLPTGDELTLRTNYADQSVWDATAMAKLPEFKKEYVVYATGATVSLPTDFRELHENPRALNTSIWDEYPEIEVEQKYVKDLSDKYCYVLGNPRDGHSLVFNNLTSATTLSIVYQTYPQGFATLTDKCELFDPTYVTRRIEYYVLYSRGDDKFPMAKTESEKVLANMVGRRSYSTGGQGKVTPVRFKNPLT